MIHGCAVACWQRCCPILLTRVCARKTHACTRARQPDDRNGEDENCALIGFHGRANWIDVQCDETKAACICERNAHYGDPNAASTTATGAPAPSPSSGGGMSGGGVFGLIVLFGALFAVGGFVMGRHPEQVYGALSAIKARVFGRRAQTMSMSAATAGLAANDSCTPYVVPSVPGIGSTA